MIEPELQQIKVSFLVVETEFYTLVCVLNQFACNKQKKQQQSTNPICIRVGYVLV